MKTKIFWCKVNKYYTEKWINSDYLKNKKGVFIASCVVTDKAKRKWLRFVKDSLKEIKKDEKIYISWCWAFKDWKAQEDFFEIYPELLNHKNKIEILGEAPEEKNNNEEKLQPLSFSIKGRDSGMDYQKLYTKKFIVIQWWCDSFCTFCLTVKKRWRHYSRDKKEIVEEILNFEKQWWKEVVLTGINLWAWGLKTTNEKGSKLYILLREILENTKIERIRISSLWPEFIDDNLIELFKETRIYPHFHLSVQSWSSRVLKLMARHYNADYLKSILEKIKLIKRCDGVDISLWADIIVWFPSETYEDFLETYNLVKDFEINKLHCFPFSAHKIWENVISWTFDNQIEEVEKKRRLKELNYLWDEIRKDFINSQNWKTLKVLIESVKWDSWKWWSENYIECDSDNFEVIDWEIKRNGIVFWKLK